MPKTKIALQDQIKQLDELVQYFENANQNFDLEAGLKKYEQAMQVVKEVRTELESYELKIKEIEAKYADTAEPAADMFN